MILLPLVLLERRTPENLTQVAAQLTCLAAMVLGIWQRSRLRTIVARLPGSAGVKLILVGGAGAVFVETEYEAWQHLLGSHGVAASPNLLIDLLVTMPWYLLMVGFLSVTLKHIRPTPFQLLLLGGVYEMMSDGLLGSSLGGSLVGLLVLSPVIYPLFTIVYSPIVLVPTLACWPALEQRWRDSPPTGPWYWAFFPCLAILPYAVFLITLLFG